MACGRGANLPFSEPRDYPGCTTRSPAGPTPDIEVYFDDPGPELNRRKQREQRFYLSSLRFLCWLLLILISAFFISLLLEESGG